MSSDEDDFMQVMVNKEPTMASQLLAPIGTPISETDAQTRLRSLTTKYIFSHGNRKFRKMTSLGDWGDAQMDQQVIPLAVYPRKEVFAGHNRNPQTKALLQFLGLPYVADQSEPAQILASSISRGMNVVYMGSTYSYVTLLYNVWTKKLVHFSFTYVPVRIRATTSI